MNRLLFSVNQIIRQSATFVTIIQCLIRLRFERYFSHHRATLFEERIHNNHVIRDRLKNSIEQLKGKILESITPEEFHLVEKIHENLHKKSFELTKTRHIRKINELISKNKGTQSATNTTDQKKWVINMSSRQLTNIKTDLFAKTLNFSITSKTLPNKYTIATIEDAVKDLEKEEAGTIRAKVSLTL